MNNLSHLKDLLSDATKLAKVVVSNTPDVDPELPPISRSCDQIIKLGYTYWPCKCTKEYRQSDAIIQFTNHIDKTCVSILCHYFTGVEREIPSNYISNFKKHMFAVQQDMFSKEAREKGEKG